MSYKGLMWENFEQCEQIQTILQVFKQISDQHVCLETHMLHITMTTKQQQLGDTIINRVKKILHRSVAWELIPFSALWAGKG